MAEWELQKHVGESSNTILRTLGHRGYLNIIKEKQKKFLANMLNNKWKKKKKTLRASLLKLGTKQAHSGPVLVISG